MAEQLLEEVQALRSEVYQLKELNESVLELFQKHVKSMALTEKMKKTGVENPRYKADVSTKELVKDYIDNDFHITNNMKKHYKEKYDISYGGMRLRLIKAGVWREREVYQEESGVTGV